MTSSYRVVQWNRHKKTYDLIMIAWIMLYMSVFVGVGLWVFPAHEKISAPVLLIRALGTCGIVMLHVILMIGPLSRLTPRVLPLLYNRRHLGVAFFVVVLVHALVVFGYYGGFGVVNPVLAVLAHPLGPTGVPYELLGFVALLIFAVMAATSHDYWLVNLGPSFWKIMHMCVYLAYVLVLAHVVFGVLENETNLVYPLLLSVGALLLAGLHLTVGLREVRRDHRPGEVGITRGDGTAWIDVCGVDDIAPDRAKVVQIGTQERIAIFRHNNAITAITNVCAHQGGPLGEGKIIDGCVTCPWHGYQYKPECGQSPPPYREKIATYNIMVEGRRVLINAVPNAPGTPTTPAAFDPWSEGLDGGTDHAPDALGESQRKGRHA